MSLISSSLNNGILLITIEREDKMNALNLELLSELDEVFNQVYDDPEVRGVIITGRGAKAFAAGADIAEFADFDEQQGREMSANGHRIFNRIENCTKPVIAAVNGFALGGGCELMMACHIRIASTNARFGQPEVTLGVVPGYGGTQRLTSLVGRGKALELLMTGEMIKADEAYRLGLVNHVVEQEELISRSEKMLQTIFKKGPLAIAGVIKCVNAYFNENINGYDFEIEEFASGFSTKDFKEGTTAFVEKREAEFSGC